MSAGMSSSAVVETDQAELASKIQDFRATREKCQYRCDQLREQQAKLVAQIDEATREIRDGGIPSSVRLNELAQEKFATDKDLKLATVELNDSQIILDRHERKLARLQLDGAYASMIALRHEIITLLHEASDRYGRLILLQQGSVKLVNQLGATPPDVNLIREMGSRLEPWRCAWMNARVDISTKLLPGSSPTLIPTTPL